MEAHIYFIVHWMGSFPSLNCTFCLLLTCIHSVSEMGGHFFIALKTPETFFCRNTSFICSNLWQHSLWGFPASCYFFSPCGTFASPSTPFPLQLLKLRSFSSAWKHRKLMWAGPAPGKVTSLVRFQATPFILHWVHLFLPFTALQ